MPFHNLKPAFHAPDEFGLFLLAADEIIERHLSELKKICDAPNASTIANTADLESAAKLNEFTADREAERDQQLACLIARSTRSPAPARLPSHFQMLGNSGVYGKEILVQLIPQMAAFPPQGQRHRHPVFSARQCII